jgi:sugar lactone lactonase YvrE
MSHPVHFTEVLHLSPREEGRFLPEGPRRVAVGGRVALAWVNIQTAVDATAGEIHLHFDDNGEHRAIPLPARPGFAIPLNRPDMVVVGMEKEVGTLNLASQEWSPLATIPDPHPRTIINDGEMTPDGSAIVFGTKDLRFAEPLGHLYLLTLADRQLTVLKDGQTCSNGKFFTETSAELLLYDIDTPKRALARYRLDVKGRRLVSPDAVEILDLRKFDGFPDGMCDVGEGSVIIAFYNPHRGGDGQALRLRLADGAILEEWITLGSPRVTCPLLVREGGKVRIVLTTATEGMPADQRADSPNAGAVFTGPTQIVGIA